MDSAASGPTPHHTRVNAMSGGRADAAPSLCARATDAARAYAAASVSPLACASVVTDGLGSSARSPAALTTARRTDGAWRRMWTAPCAAATLGGAATHASRPFAPVAARLTAGAPQSVTVSAMMASAAPIAHSHRVAASMAHASRMPPACDRVDASPDGAAHSATCPSARSRVASTAHACRLASAPASRGGAARHATYALVTRRSVLPRARGSHCRRRRATRRRWSWTRRAGSHTWPRGQHPQRSARCASPLDLTHDYNLLPPHHP